MNSHRTWWQNLRPTRPASSVDRTINPNVIVRSPGHMRSNLSRWTILPSVCCHSEVIISTCKERVSASDYGVQEHGPDHDSNVIWLKDGWNGVNTNNQSPYKCFWQFVCFVRVYSAVFTTKLESWCRSLYASAFLSALQFSSLVGRSKTLEPDNLSAIHARLSFTLLVIKYKSRLRFIFEITLWQKLKGRSGAVALNGNALWWSVLCWKPTKPHLRLATFLRCWRHWDAESKRNVSF